MAWTVTRSCSSIVTKRESTRHRRRPNTHWAEITLCQHHRRHSRRGITKNVHSLFVSLDCRRQGPRHVSLHQHLAMVSQGCTLRLYCKTGVSPGKVAFSAVPSILENLPLEFGAAFKSMSSKVFSLAPNSRTMNSANLLCHSGYRSRRHVPPVAICSECRILGH